VDSASAGALAAFAAPQVEMDMSSLIFSGLNAVSFAGYYGWYSHVAHMHSLQHICQAAVRLNWVDWSG